MLISAKDARENNAYMRDCASLAATVELEITKSMLLDPDNRSIELDGIQRTLFAVHSVKCQLESVGYVVVLEELGTWTDCDNYPSNTAIWVGKLVVSW